MEKQFEENAKERYELLKLTYDALEVNNGRKE